MKKPDFRIKDDPTIWSKIPRKADDAFDYLFEKLIERNAPLMKLAEKHECGPWNEPVRKKIHAHQEVFVLIYRFDSQILNGGVTQFLWNCFDDDINNVIDKGIEKLHLPELEKLYERMLEKLNEKFDEWDALHVKGHEAGGTVGIQCFTKTYKLLGLDWFNKEYLAKHRNKLIETTIQFVKENKHRFVK